MFIVNHAVFHRLLLLSYFSLTLVSDSCVTPQTAAHQAPLSLGFSRQGHWSGLPFPSLMHESEKWKWRRWVVSGPQRPIDCSLSGSSIHGILQARVLEWGAIAFSIFHRQTLFNCASLYCSLQISAKICGNLVWKKTVSLIFPIVICLVHVSITFW